MKNLFAAVLCISSVSFGQAAFAQRTAPQPPQNPSQVPVNGVGARPGAIPILGTGQNVIRNGQVVPINNSVGGTIRNVGGVIVPANGSYTPNPYGYYGGGNTTVIINGYGYNNGYNGYPNNYGYYNNGYGFNNGVTYIGGGSGGQYTNSYSTGYVSGGPVSGFAGGGYVGGNSVINSGVNGGYSNLRRLDAPNVVRGVLPNPNVVLPGTPLTQTVTTGNVSTTTLFDG